MDERQVTSPLSVVEGQFLARLAVSTIAAELAGVRLDDEPPESAALLAPGASFVTLENDGRLRGCVGTLDAVRPLYQDAMRNARRAMKDPRLPEVTVADWPGLDVTVSVLTRPEPLPVDGREDLLAQLRPGVDGLLLTSGSRRSTFLPAVWDKLPNPDQFVAALLVKGGWPAGGWPGGLVAARYTAMEFADHPPRPPLAARTGPPVPG